MENIKNYNNSKICICLPYKNITIEFTILCENGRFGIAPRKCFIHLLKYYSVKNSCFETQYYQL